MLDLGMKLSYACDFKINHIAEGISIQNPTTILAEILVGEPDADIVLPIRFGRGAGLLGALSCSPSEHIDLLQNYVEIGSCIYAVRKLETSYLRYFGFVRKRRCEQELH